MKIRKSWSKTLFPIVIALLLVASWAVIALGYVSQPATGAASTPPRAARTASPPTARRSMTSIVYLPVVMKNHPPSEITINEVMPKPSAGEAEWVELYNCGLSSIDIVGYEVSDEDDNVYAIPSALPSVPPGAYVLIMFDGVGSGNDDYDLSDNLAILHTPVGLTDVFEDDVDQVALYARSTHNSSTIRDFVAYGGPAEEDDDDAAVAGLWPVDGYTGPTTQVPGGELLGPGGSIGLYSGRKTHTPVDWVVYALGETSPGEQNPAPAPYFRNPPDGIATTDHQIPFGWSNTAGAESYHLEIDDDPAFGSPAQAVDVPESSYVPTEPFRDGTFYYRVKAQFAGGSESGWSSTGEVTFITVDAVGAGLMTQTLLSVTPQLQHKDSRLLCLDGSSETGQHRWDSAHEDDGDLVVGNGTPVRGCPLCDSYCTRASISMIVSYHGGHLSQDRISYYAYGGGAPEDDLGHDRGLWPNKLSTWGIGKNVFDWAMNGNAVTSSRGKPSFSQVKGWIDAGRPLLIVENNDSHSVVLDGYLDILWWELAHRVDPSTASGSWVSWDSWSVSEYHVPPDVTPRSDEATVSHDSDDDGIVDFDEQNRFSTDPNNKDSDDDYVRDKQDVRGYVFDNDGNYSYRIADRDGDSLRKELDRDNDNGGALDGCEDADKDGRTVDNWGWRDDGKDTSNFDWRDDANAPECRCPPSIVEVCAGQGREIRVGDVCNNGIGYSIPGPAGGEPHCTYVDCCNWYQTAHVHDLGWVVAIADLIVEYTPGCYHGCEDIVTIDTSPNDVTWTTRASFPTQSVSIPGGWTTYTQKLHDVTNFRYVRITLPHCYNDLSAACTCSVP